MCMVVSGAQSSFVLGTVCKAKRLFASEKDCTLGAKRYLTFCLLLLQVVQRGDFFSVCVYACKHTAFCAKRPFQIGALGQQLSNLTDCLPDMFCLFFPSKLKFKEKEREVHFPSPD